MKKARKKRRLKPRLPAEAVLKLRSTPLTTKKGEKGYRREKTKKQTLKTVREKV